MLLFHFPMSWDPYISGHCIAVWLTFLASAVGVAKSYELGCPGIESWLGEIFCTHPEQPWGPSRLLENVPCLSFPGVKRLGRSVDSPPGSSVEVKEIVELYV